MDNNKIGTIEAILATLIVAISHLILILPKLVLQSQGSSSIINIIYITLVALFITFILNILYKNFKGMDILDISGYLFGNVFKFIIGIIYIAYLLFITSLLLRNTSENIRTMYFQSTPTPIILFFILLTAGFVNRYGIKNVIKCNMIMTILVLIAIISLFILSSNNFEFDRVFPMLGYGAKTTFVDGLANISIFGNILMLFFIMPLLKNTDNFSKVSYISIILTGLFILISVGSLLLMFPISISSGSNIPLYLQTRMITLGRLIQRVDAFFIIIWIFSILSYVSIVIALSSMIFRKITQIDSSSRISYSLSAILFGICLIYRNLMQIRKLDIQGYKLLPLIVTFGLTFAIIIAGNIKKKILRNRKKGEILVE